MLDHSPSSRAAAMAAIGHERLKAGDRGNGRALLTGAIEQDADCADAWRSLGAAVAGVGRHEAAAVAANRAVAINPDDATAWSNLGVNLWRMQHYAEAHAAYLRSLALQPDDGPLHHRLGLNYYSTGDVKSAIEHLERAIKLGPDNNDARSDLALARLKSGDLHQGLIEHEIRWNTLGKTAVWDCGLPRWEGQDLEGKTILVHHEQGIGDTLMFVRFLPWLKWRRDNRFITGEPKVIFAAPRSLISLLEGQCGIDQVIDIESPGAIVRGATNADYHCPMLSVARVRGATYDNLPPAPYLTVTPSSMALKTPGTKLAVGITWAASPGREHSRRRSVPLGRLIEAAAIPGVRLYSLQVGPFAKDLAETGADHIVTDLSASIRDFADTAALMQQLDLVVSVDSAPAHLAGALGVPVWMFNAVPPCWRWCRGAERWYGSMKAIDRSRPDDWSDAIAVMKAGIVQLTQSAPSAG